MLEKHFWYLSAFIIYFHTFEHNNILEYSHSLSTNTPESPCKSLNKINNTPDITFLPKTTHGKKTDSGKKAAAQLCSEKIYFMITSDWTSVFTVCYSVSDSSDRVWGCPVTVAHHQRGGIYDTVWVIRETEEWMFLLWHINNTERVSKTEGGLESCLHSQLC